MSVTAQEEIVREMAEVIVAAANPRKIVLFGSQAQGAAGPGSDVDLLVVEDEPFGPGRSRRREMARLSRLLARFRLPQDILVYSAEETEHWAKTRNHVIARALREGRVVYERP